jgi:protein-ribulosamine 3-kinase
MFSEKDILALLHKHLNSIDIKGIRAMGGSFENSIHRVLTTNCDFLIKINGKQNTKAEVNGLELLKSTKTVNTPEIIGYGETDEKGYLILEFLKGSRKSNYWIELGENLARLHQTTHEAFGLEHNNFIGALPQINDFKKSWTDFFVTCRIQPQLDLAKGKLPIKVLEGFDKLIPKLHSLLPVEGPALLHGDLWSGNVMTNNAGDPVLIDPAVYFGHREIEIAFTHLFGGFDDNFYNSYHSAFPLPSDFRERIDLYNLYPLLVHVNLFGGNYVNQVEAILQRFI